MLALKESAEMGREAFGTQEEGCQMHGLKWLSQKEFCLVLACCFVCLNEGEKYRYML